MHTVFDEEGEPLYPFSRVKEFPALPIENLVERQSFLETIERMFFDVQMVFLEGGEGFGATTTAAQFCTAYPENSLCLFIKRSSRITYSADYLRLVLAEQLTWLLEEKEFAGDTIDPSQYRAILFKLRRKTSKKKPVYIVVDGLQKILDVEGAVEEIFKEVLPLWLEDVKFLICGRQKDFELHIPDVSTKYIQQMTLSPHEAQQFLLPVILEKDEVPIIHSLCHGVPARLASVRRLMMNGTSLQEILDSSPERFPSFVKLEFARVGDVSDQARKMLSVITFSNRQLSQSELQAITGFAGSILEEVFEACPFVIVAGTDERIEFVSDAHRRLAATILAVEKNYAITENIKHLSLNPGTLEAVSYLPIYYQQLDKAAELVRLLTPDHFSQLLALTSSLGALRARAKIGMRSSVSLEQPNEVLAFSLMQSVFLSIAKSEGSNAEVRALVALGQHQTALSIALNRATNEERLKFLATYAKKCKEMVGVVDAQVFEAIHVAAKSIDFRDLGDAAIELAAEIVHVDQELAMSIVDTLVKGANSRDRDVAIARLSLEVSGSPAGKTSGRHANSSQMKISDAKLQVFVSSVTALVSDYSFRDIIETCVTLDQSRQLEFLGYWIGQHKRDPSAVDVTEHGLNLMISQSAHSPKMREFRALAVSLPFSADLNKARSLVRRFDSQRGLIQDAAISTDTVGLQMTLAHAEMSFDITAASTRIIDCYLELSTSDNADTKLEGLSLMLRFLNSIDKDGKLEAEHGFKAVIDNELSNLLSNVLGNSADHLLIVKFVLAQFASFDFATAVRIAVSLNTEDRRDRAFMEICKALHSGDVLPSSVDNLITALEYMRDENFKLMAFEGFVENLSVRKIKLIEPAVKVLESYLNSIRNDLVNARSLVLLTKIRRVSELSLNTVLIVNFERLVPRIEASYHRAALYFDMCDAIASTDADQAKAYYILGAEARDGSVLRGVPNVQIMTYCLTLCSRAFGGAMASGSMNESMLKRIIQLIELLPSTATKVDIIADLASRAWIAGRTDIAKRLMGEHVIPALDAARSVSAYDANYLATIAIPALYCTHQQIAISQLKLLSRQDKETTILLAIDLIITKSPRADPDLGGTKDDFVLQYSEVLDLMALIDLIEEDWNLSGSINRLAESVTHKKNQNHFTAQQRNDIADRLQVVVEKVLPDRNNISHDGYLILCGAYLLRLRANVMPADWESVIEKANTIANVADRGYTVYEISKLLPVKMNARRMSLQTDVLTLFKQVPSVIDKINRLIVLSNGVAKDGVAVAKQSLKAAMSMTLHAIDEEVARDSRRRIIDIADKISPEFAEELSELIDTDSARRHARLEVRDRLKMLAVKKKISDVKTSSKMSPAEVLHLPEASWKNLLGLIGGRLEIKAPALMVDYLEESAQFELKDAVPILSWYIENNNRKYASSKDVGGQISFVAEKLLLAAEFSANVVIAVSAKQSDFGRVSTGEIEKSDLIGLNNRAQVLSFIEVWLTECAGEIVLCDPYFGVKEADLEFLRLVLRASPAAGVSILTSKSILAEQGANTEELFMEKWRATCDQEPPATRIVGIGNFNNKKSAIHDRWLICKDRGLRLGTSFNGIGTGKLSAISSLTDGEVVVTAAELRRFLSGEHFIDGERISYSSFSI